MIFRDFSLAFVAVVASCAHSTNAQERTKQSFAVAVIRPIKSNEQHGAGWKVTHSGRFTATECLQNLMIIAYGTDGSIVGGPTWADTDWFDINAKLDESNLQDWDKLTDAEQYDRVKPIIRSLLAEPFKLKLHTEMRLTPVYALMQAKGGAKLIAAMPSSDAADLDKAEVSNEALQKGQSGGFTRTGNVITATSMSMQSLKSMVAAWTGVDRLVTDETNLKGTYSFTFKMSLDKTGPTIAEQIEQQLGLKLEPRKVQMTTYVIDSAEKPTLDGE
jgi:uncharacterized protein (TIGR03435 family)